MVVAAVVVVQVSPPVEADARVVDAAVAVDLVVVAAAEEFAGSVGVAAAAAPGGDPVGAAVGSEAASVAWSTERSHSSELDLR